MAKLKESSGKQVQTCVKRLPHKRRQLMQIMKWRHGLILAIDGLL